MSSSPLSIEIRSSRGPLIVRLVASLLFMALPFCLSAVHAVLIISIGLVLIWWPHRIAPSPAGQLQLRAMPDVHFCWAPFAAPKIEGRLAQARHFAGVLSLQGPAFSLTIWPDMLSPAESAALRAWLRLNPARRESLAEPTNLL